MKLKHGVLLGVILALLLWGLVVTGAFSFYLKVPEALWEDLMPLPKSGERVSVLIEPGMSARQAAQAFETQGALEGSVSRFIYWMTRFGLDRRIRAGYYQVIRSDPWRLARQLRGMRPALLRVTILPGMDVFSLRDVLSGDENPRLKGDGAQDASSFAPADALSAALLDNENYPEEMRAKLPSDEASRIAFLRPETYLVVERTPQELVRVASSAWWERWGASADILPPAYVQKNAVIASMVEREVLHDVECQTVAGVIQNRLEKKMPLQIDATVVYAWKLRGRRLTRVLNRDLEIDSPYNTYRVSGLPPHPICVPGAAAWDAAFRPEVNDYLYYVAGKNGYHYFAKTYSEHLRNVKKARER
ncbi:MAG: endolytic transglycosylase MltG [Fretibacterium sp.]|nr:endolytic transglycosylase MltG [Fretibacterium sp.]